jgi:hypothetical protein
MKSIPFTTLNRLPASRHPHIEQQWLAAVAAVGAKLAAGQ